MAVDPSPSKTHSPPKQSRNAQHRRMQTLATRAAQSPSLVLGALELPPPAEPSGLNAPAPAPSPKPMSRLRRTAAGQDDTPQPGDAPPALVAPPFPVLSSVSGPMAYFSDADDEFERFASASPMSNADSLPLLDDAGSDIADADEPLTVEQKKKVTKKWYRRGLTAGRAESNRREPGAANPFSDALGGLGNVRVKLDEVNVLDAYSLKAFGAGSYVGYSTAQLERNTLLALYDGILAGPEQPAHETPPPSTPVLSNSSSPFNASPPPPSPPYVVYSATSSPTSSDFDSESEVKSNSASRPEEVGSSISEASEDDSEDERDVRKAPYNSIFYLDGGDTFQPSYECDYGDKVDVDVALEYESPDLPPKPTTFAKPFAGVEWGIHDGDEFW